MRILVTGGAGFIGSHVVDAYIAAGHTVAVVDNLATGNAKAVHPKAMFFEYDICDDACMNHAFSKFGPEVINHHAAQTQVRRSMDDPKFDMQVNIGGSLNLLRHCQKYGVKRFIYAASGGSMYGNVLSMAAYESQHPKPESYYGISKYTVEHYLAVIARQTGLHYVALRYGNVYGPRQSPDGEAGVVSIFLGKMLKREPVEIFGDGTQIRDYVYVGDVVRANLAALTTDFKGGAHVGTGIGTSTLDMFRTLSRLLAQYDILHPTVPVHSAARAGDIQEIVLHQGKSMRNLPWQTETKLEEGLRATMLWLRDGADPRGSW